MRACRTGNDANTLDRRRDLEGQVGLAPADGHLQGEIAIRTLGLDRKLAQITAKRRVQRIDQREKHLGADVARSGSAPLLRRRWQTWFPAGRKIRRLLIATIGAVRSIEG